MKKIQKDEFLFFLSTRKKIIALAKIIAKCNKDYYLENSSLKTQTKDRLVCVLNSQGWIKNELESHGIKPSKNNIILAKETRAMWRHLIKKSDWLVQNCIYVCFKSASEK